MVKVAGARVVCSCRADKPWKMVGMRMLVVDPRLVTDSHSQALLTPMCDYCHTTTETISSYGHNNPDEPVSDSGNKLLTCSSSSFLVKSWFIDLPHKMQTYDTIKMATCPGTFRLDLVYILGMQFLYRQVAGFLPDNNQRIIYQTSLFFCYYSIPEEREVASDTLPLRYLFLSSKHEHLRLLLY